MTREGASLLRVIAIFKLLKAAILAASLAAVFNLIHHDDPLHTAIAWALKIHVDPDGQYLRAGLAKLLGFDAPQLEMLAIGTAAYALLFAAEGLGLLFEKTWAEYLTLVATAGFIPIEVYEIAQRVSGTRVALLAVNVAIVAYLASRVRRLIFARG